MSILQSFKCPHCHKDVSLNDLMKTSIAVRLREESKAALLEEHQKIEQAFSDKLAEKEAVIAETKRLADAANLAKIKAEKEADQRQATLDLEVTRLVSESVEKEKNRILAQSEQQASTVIKDLEARIRAAESIAKQSQGYESELRSKLRETESALQAVNIEVDRKLDEEKRIAEERGFARANEESKKQTEALVHQNTQLQTQIADLQRKAIQGSQQAQGERLELQLEGMLKAMFPMDEIKEVKKGSNGADVIQHVLSPAGKLLGTIVWETKNAQNWKNEWVEKLKADTREANGQIGILVSNALPKGCNTIAFREGVVLCDTKVADGVAATMRNQILEIAQTKAAGDSKDSLQATIYEYIASQKFTRRLESAIHPIKEMREALTKEMTYADRTFASREMKIREVAKGLVGLYGDVYGMLGDAVPKIPQLEFDTE